MEVLLELYVCSLQPFVSIRTFVHVLYTRLCTFSVNLRLDFGVHFGDVLRFLLGRCDPVLCSAARAFLAVLDRIFPAISFRRL